MSDDKEKDLNANQKEVWNQIADSWVNLINKPYVDPNREKIIYPTMGKMLGNVKGKLILDVGCGEGSLCRFLLKKDAEVFGIDFSSQLIEHAKKQTPKGKEISYKIGNAEKLDEFFDDEFFDICIVNLSMINFENIDVVVSKIAKVLKNDGEFIFSILHPCFPVTAYEDYEKAIDDPGFNNPENYEWPSGSYFNRKEIYRKIHPSFPKPSRFYRRMLEEYFFVLTENGFVVNSLIEPRPPVSVIEDTEYKAHDKYPQFPLFVFIKAIKQRDSNAVQTEVLEKFLIFRNERDWGKFQTTKNNAISLILEASEFLEHFHWLEDQKEFDQYIGEYHEKLEDELADVYMNLLILAKDLGVNLNEVATKKIKFLNDKYPKNKVYGKSIKPSDKPPKKNKGRYR